MLKTNIWSLFLQFWCCIVCVIVVCGWVSNSPLEFLIMFSRSFQRTLRLTWRVWCGRWSPTVWARLTLAWTTATRPLTTPGYDRPSAGVQRTRDSKPTCSMDFTITTTEQPYVSDILNHQTSSKHDWNWFCVVYSLHSWHYGALVCYTLTRFKCNEFGDALFPQNDLFLLFSGLVMIIL